MLNQNTITRMKHAVVFTNPRKDIHLKLMCNVCAGNKDLSAVVARAIDLRLPDFSTDCYWRRDMRQALEFGDLEYATRLVREADDRQ